MELKEIDRKLERLKIEKENLKSIKYGYEARLFHVNRKISDLIAIKNCKLRGQGNEM